MLTSCGAGTAESLVRGVCPNQAIQAIPEEATAGIHTEMMIAMGVVVAVGEMTIDMETGIGTGKIDIGRTDTGMMTDLRETPLTTDTRNRPGGTETLLARDTGVLLGRNLETIESVIDTRMTVMDLGQGLVMGMTNMETIPKVKVPATVMAKTEIGVLKRTIVILRGASLICSVDFLVIGTVNDRCVFWKLSQSSPQCCKVSVMTIVSFFVSRRGNGSASGSKADEYAQDER
jgi:hypothetical protein